MRVSIVSLLLLASCSRAPNVSYDFNQSPPAELKGLERHQWLAEHIDKEVAIPTENNFKVTYSTGSSHSLNGVLPMDGRLEVRPTKASSYNEYYHDTQGRLVLVALHQGDKAIPVQKLIYQQGKLLGSVSYSQGKASDVRLLEWSDEDPKAVSHFRLDPSGKDWKVGKGRWMELPISAVRSYQAQRFAWPESWTEAALVDYIERFDMYPFPQPGQQPPVPYSLALSVAEKATSMKLLRLTLFRAAPVNRQKALIAGAEGDLKRFVALLTVLMKDKDASRRYLGARACYLLANAGLPGEVKPILQQLAARNQPWNVRAAALSVLFDADKSLGAKTMELTLAALSSDSEHLASWAAELLYHRWRSDARLNSMVLNAIHPALKSAYPVVRGYAARILAEQQPGSAVFIRPMLDDPHAFVRASAALALGQLRDADSQSLIVRKLKAVPRDEVSVVRLARTGTDPEGIGNFHSFEVGESAHTVDSYALAFARMHPTYRGEQSPDAELHWLRFGR